ncbi:Superkiller protein 3 [Malassezia yamatoensis]|uniref:Superkiller protein 3 n=1 Tax=Malassezia yamatoensis TaxID=253288 RepID=A0AAJ5Z0C7_9BASI|nr:Superkiller protein 3 [Malassezia yamatoensis]
MSNVDKQLLRECRSLLQKGDWDGAGKKALVFQGVARLHQGEQEASESSYLKATKIDAKQVLAWQNWIALVNVYRQLANLAFEEQDAVKCGNALTKIISIQRQHGSPAQLADALKAMTPISRYFSLLETLPVPDQAAPSSNPAFNAQMLVHAAALENLHELADLYAELETAEIEDIVKRQKSTLEGAKLGITLLRDHACMQVLKRSRVPDLLDLIRNHPRTEDGMRRDAEAKLLRHFYKLTLAVPIKGPQSNPAMKETVMKQTIEFARGFVVLQVPDELAWSIYLDWSDFRLPNLPYGSLVDYVRLFPKSPRTRSIRALLCLVGDEAYQRGDAGEATREHKLQETDLLQLALDGLEMSKNALFAQRIAAEFYLLDRDFVSAAEVLEAARSQLEKQKQQTGAEFIEVDMELAAELAIAYTHLRLPKYYRDVRVLLNKVSAQNKNDLVGCMARAYFFEAHNEWAKAKAMFEKALKLVDLHQRQLDKSPQSIGRNLQALDLSPDFRLEARSELAWCFIQTNQYQEARSLLDQLIASYDNQENVFGAEFRARLWWLSGRCYWMMGGKYRHDPSNAYHCYVAAIQRYASYAPAFTALGQYYEQEVSPPDTVRASKCFQKAFELEATEYQAAKRLIESFADQRDWELVETVAQRVIEAEGGKDTLDARPQAAVHITSNAWVWKAMGIVESIRHRPERAITALQITLRATPQDIDAWVRIGEAYLAFGRPIPALKTFARALHLLETTNHDAQVEKWHVDYLVAEAQRRLGRFDRAAKILSKILADSSSQYAIYAVLAETRLSEARNLLSSGFVARAHSALIMSLRDAAHALHADKLLNTAWKVAADACFLLSRLDLAADAQQADGKWSTGIRSVLYDMMLLLTQMDSDARLEAINVVNANDVMAYVPSQDDETLPSTEEYLMYAVLCYKYLAVAHPKESKTAVFAWSDLALSLASFSWHLHANQHLERSAIAHDQAAECVRLALSIKPQTRLWLLLGNLYFKKDPATAQHAYIMAIESSAKNAAPWTHLGFLYLSQGDSQLAEQAFVRAQTIAPDWPASWLGRAMVLAQHSTDLRARVSLLEHACSLSENTLLEADYAFAYASFLRRKHLQQPSSRQVIAPLLALDHFLARKPKHATAQHLSALLAEQVGMKRLAITRIENANTQLESDFEASENASVALQYGFASMNLGRIRLAQHDAQGALEAFEGAQALLSEESSDDSDSSGINADQLSHARQITEIGLASANYWLGNTTEAISQLLTTQNAFPSSSVSESWEKHLHAEVSVLLTRMRWNQRDVDSVSHDLDTALAAAPTNTLLITTRAAVAAALGDSAQYNEVLAQYAAALPEQQRKNLRNTLSTAKLSVWQLAAVFPLDALLQHLSNCIASSETSPAVRVFAAETLMNVAAEHVLRQAAMPRLSLNSEQRPKSVLEIAHMVLKDILSQPEANTFWGQALEVLTLAEILTLRAGDSLQDPIDSEQPLAGDQDSDHAQEDAVAPSPLPTSASVLHHAASAMHCAPWRPTSQRLLEAVRSAI